MKQFEFETQLGQDGKITIPASCAKEIPAGQGVRVVLLVPDVNEDGGWANLTAEQFEQGYADSDANYDQLSKG